MTTKVSKLNIVLIAITLLLVFVGIFNFWGQTNSWLVAGDTINITISVSEIDIKVKQGERIVEDNGYIYLGNQFIQADTLCDFEDVQICNQEVTSGYYIRCQLFAKIGDKLYNINNCVANELYKNDDGWMYYSGGSDINVAKPMETKGTVTIIESITIPDLLEDNEEDSDDVYFSDIQGKTFTLHLFIEGSIAQYDIQ